MKRLTNMDVSALRRDYRDSSLDESKVEPDPVDQFRVWFEQAIDAESRDPSAMTLGTADANGRPSGRIVLLKGFDGNGFIFYTNYGSRKARELAENPWAALTFWWTELDRQVRIEGRVVRTSYATSKEYFATRPRDSQLGAVGSPQSRIIPDRETLIEAFETARKECEGGDVPCPTNWGGYRLKPYAFEFWQGRPSRLHDRIAYRLDQESEWIIERLAP